MTEFEKKKRIIRFISAAASLALMGIIFFLSAQRGEESDDLSIGLIASLFGGFNKALALNALIREFGHILEFGALALPVYIFFSSFGFGPHRAFWSTSFFGFFFAVSDEIHQFFVPGRGCEFADIVADTLGAVIMSLILFVIHFKARKKKNSQSDGENEKIRDAERSVLEAFSAFVRSEDYDAKLNQGDFGEFIGKSFDHKILPMTGSVILRGGSGFTDRQLDFIRNESFGQVAVQTRKTSQFLKAYREMISRGAKPLCVKGIICRALYPDFDLRISSDEDLVACDEDFSVCAETLLDLGFEPLDGGKNYETGYIHKESGCVIELHKTLFPDDGAVYTRFNVALGDIFERPASLRVEKAEIFCPCNEKHFIYLVLHAFKHFLIAGVGIRQIADISLFAKATALDWDRVFEICSSLNIDGFLCAVLSIGKKYFDFDASAVKCADFVPVENTDDIIADIMGGAIYGSRDADKIHSGIMTFNYYAGTIGCGRATVSTALFPPAESMIKKYPFLKGKKYLLPFAYLMRISGYIFSEHDSGNTVSEAGRREKLMARYGIFK